MSVLRQQGRPRGGPLSVGRDKIVADTLDLLRKGQTFATRKELASKIGITPALINYYFGSKCDFIGEPIRRLVEGYAEQFRQAIGPSRQECRAAMRSALPVIVRMYVEDGPLLAHYADLSANGSGDCAIKRMKRDLASIFHDADEEAGMPHRIAATMAAMIWGACSAVEDETDMFMCIELADQLIAKRDMLRATGRTEVAEVHALANEYTSSSRCHLCESASLPIEFGAGV